MKPWQTAATSRNPVEYVEPICAALDAVVGAVVDPVIGAVVGAIEEHVAD